ncbi:MULTISPECIES: class I SAM-dependent methyltransferase [unclassified Bradyrhizobium]|uniref:class I SAM-dependent methyltransferase n=1 Tax=unclassified Bradyrhizobium TaxID=2631580 RepID=UPI00339AF805
MKKLVRRLFNQIGFDISRADNGKPRWSGIAGDYYPIDPRARWGHGQKSHPQIEELLTSQLEDFKKLINEIEKYKRVFSHIPFEAASPTAPFWNNTWFSTLDAASLMFFIYERSPKTYLEIGSGFSTKFARTAIDAAGSGTKLCSIDPHPRSEIDDICDEVTRIPLELVDLQAFESLTANDIAFFDGSHRIFTNSDTTVFLLDVLPRLKPGVLVHFHDIFWPDDYIPEWNVRLYSEQYALGAMLLGGMSRYRVVLPNYFVSTNPETAPLVGRLGIPITYPRTNKPGLSFWIEVLS